MTSMRSIATLVLLLVCVTRGATQMLQRVSPGKPIYSAVGHNLIENGYFADVGTYLAGKGMYHAKYVTGWEVEVAEVGPGEVFNSKWGKDTNVAQLDVDHNTAYHLPLKLSKGNYYGAFDWAPSQHGSLVTSQIELRWNGNLMTTLRPSLNEIFTQIMVLQLSGNVSILTFTGAGYSDGVGAGITNVRVFAASNYSTLPLSQSGFTVLKGFQRRSLIHNLDLGELLSSFQFQFEGHQATYYMAFDFVPFVDRPASYSKFRIALNSKEILSLQPKSYGMHHQFVMFQGRKGSNTLTFEHNGPYDSYGADIVSLKVHPISDKGPVEAKQSLKSNKAKLLNTPQLTEPQGILLPRITPINVAPNGALQMENFARNKKMKVNHLQNWEISGPGEIGQGPLYNGNWDNGTKVALLDPQQNTNYTAPLELNPGFYYAQFDMAAHSNPFKASSVQVKWNGQHVYTFTLPSEQIYRQSLLFLSDGSRNLLTFAEAGVSDGVGAMFANLSVYKISLLPKHIRDQDYKVFDAIGCINYNIYLQYNYIWNGKFQLLPRVNATPEGIYFFHHNQMPEWQVLDKGEIGPGPLYNQDWDRNVYVAQLDVVENSMYTVQFWGLKYDAIIYYLSFDYSPRDNHPLETSQITVLLNRQIIFSIFPTTYQIQRQFVLLVGKKGTNYLSFMGDGPPDGFGASITNVQVQQP